MNALILLLAGQSHRLNLSTKKQFIMLNGKPLFVHTFEAFKQTNLFDKYCLVVSKDDESLVKDYMKEFLNDNISYVIGGSTRQESVHNGLVSLKHALSVADNVLIHDAARVNVSKELISNILQELKHSCAVIPAIDVVDSMVNKTNDNFIKNYVNRDEYKLVQTPQGFKYKDILDAHTAFKNEQVTDDASLILKMNKSVKLVKGDRLNFKVTTTEDLELIKYILEAKK